MELPSHRKYSKSIIFLILLCSCYIGKSLARDLDTIQKSGTLKVAVDGTTPPFNFYQGRELVGFEVDLVKAIADKLKVKIEWIIQPFNTLLIAINQDKFDLIATSFSITPERAKVVDFLVPHYCTGAVIITKPGGPSTATELTQKTVSVAVGTVYYEKLKTLSGIKEILTVNNETDGLMALDYDRADAWVTQKEVAAGAIKNLAKQKDYLVGEMLLQQTNAMVVAKDNIKLKQAINNIFHELQEDGTVNNLMKKYFTEDIRCTPIH